MLVLQPTCTPSAAEGSGLILKIILCPPPQPGSKVLTDDSLYTSRCMNHIFHCWNKVTGLVPISLPCVWGDDATAYMVENIPI